MGRRSTLALLLAVTALAGCGGSRSSADGSSSGEASKSGIAILADARKAALAADSVRIVGSVHNAKQRISLDLSLAQNNGGGTLTLDGSKIDVIRVGKTAYIRASAAFYRRFGAKTAAQLPAGKW
ncbi:MAG TPA: hypothetical protein VFA66_13360, partial [Gaiellaceae bacterium]|nr:hypothetical protein [Gaiellaceae bacterium]